MHNAGRHRPGAAFRTSPADTGNLTHENHRVKCLHREPAGAGNAQQPQGKDNWRDSRDEPHSHGLPGAAGIDSTPVLVYNIPV